MSNHGQAHYTGAGTCLATGKAIHPTRAAARIVRNRLRDGGTRLRIYPCDACQGYHLGHTPADLRNGTITREKWLGES